MVSKNEQKKVKREEQRSYHRVYVVEETGVDVGHSVGDMLDLEPVDNNPNKTQRQLDIAVNDILVTNRLQWLVRLLFQERQRFGDVGHLMDTHVATLRFQWLLRNNLQQTNKSLSVLEVLFNRRHRAIRGGCGQLDINPAHEGCLLGVDLGCSELADHVFGSVEMIGEMVVVVEATGEGVCIKGWRFEVVGVIVEEGGR